MIDQFDLLDDHHWNHMMLYIEHQVQQLQDGLRRKKKGEYILVRIIENFFHERKYRKRDTEKKLNNRKVI